MLWILGAVVALAAAGLTWGLFEAQWVEYLEREAPVRGLPPELDGARPTGPSRTELVDDRDRRAASSGFEIDHDEALGKSRCRRCPREHEPMRAIHLAEHSVGLDIDAGIAAMLDDREWTADVRRDLDATDLAEARAEPAANDVRIEKRVEDPLGSRAEGAPHAHARWRR